MLCKELPDDDSIGVTFKSIKDCYSMLDIIELEKTSCEDAEEDDEETLFNPSGYEELAQALRSVIWSNVDVNHGNDSLNWKVFSFIKIDFSFPRSFIERSLSSFQWWRPRGWNRSGKRTWELREAPQPDDSVSTGHQQHVTWGSSQLRSELCWNLRKADNARWRCQSHRQLNKNCWIKLIKNFI